MQINIEKRYFLIILGVMFLLAGAMVYAYGGSNPSVVGHTGGEINHNNCEWVDFTSYFGISGSKDTRNYLCPSGKILTGVKLGYWTWTGGNAPEGTYINSLYCCD